MKLNKSGLAIRTVIQMMLPVEMILMMFISKRNNNYLGQKEIYIKEVKKIPLYDKRSNQFINDNIYIFNKENQIMRIPRGSSIWR